MNGTLAFFLGALIIWASSNSVTPACGRRERADRISSMSSASGLGLNQPVTRVAEPLQYPVPGLIINGQDVDRRRAPKHDRPSDFRLHRAVRSRLEGELYKIWNRMISGTCFPPPVRASPF
jgi:hypothetical protein